MKMQSVKSSQISEIGHDPETNTLAVKFAKGGLYHYDGVTAAQFDAIKSAESIGSHLDKHIKKGGHAFKKIDESARKGK